MPSPYPHARAARLLLVASLLCCSACDSADAPPTLPPEDPVVAGVDLDELLTPPPTADERAAVAAELDRRAAAIEPVAFRVEDELVQDGATVRVVSFGVTGLDAASREPGSFFGAVRLPDRPPAPPEPLPVLFVFPTGTDGVHVDDFLTTGGFARLGEAFVQVLVAPPGEALHAGGETYPSRVLPDAFPVLFDYEVDLARALLSHVREFPEADGDRIGAAGFGRGATVALLLAERPASDAYPFTLRAVADLAGFTDFRAPSFRSVVRQLLLEEPTLFPGGEALAADVLHPLRDRVLPFEDAREALLRRSPIYFAAALPPVLVYHGAHDPVIGDDHSARLLNVIRDRATFPPAFPELGHEDLFSDEKVRRDLARFLEETLADGV